ncbi:MAG: hypothetical protein ACRBN8_22020 [Nannocystales bacterium]
MIAGLGTPPPFLKVLLLGLSVGCFCDAVEPLRPWVEWLRLDPAAWERGEVWRMVTYGLFGRGGISAWVVLQLVLVYWLVQQLVVWVRPRRARTILLGGVAVAGVTAALAQAGSNQFGGPSCSYAPFWLMQGQNVILAIGLAAFASSNRYSTVSHTPYVFGLPIPTKWLVPLQLLMTLGGALSTGDLGGFVGIVAATAWGWTAVSRG